MSGNSFGELFKITNWGESHGKAIGVVVDGCPSMLELDEIYIKNSLTGGRRDKARLQHKGRSQIRWK